MTKKIHELETVTSFMIDAEYLDNLQKEAASKKTRKTTTRKPATKKTTTRRTSKKTTSKSVATVSSWELDLFAIENRVNFFAGVNNMKELKAKYKELAMQHHPDKGGDSNTMMEVNADFDAKAKELASRQTTEEKATTQKKAARKAEGMTAEQIQEAIAAEFKAAFEAVMVLEGVTVELIGSWLWVTGDTKTNREALKAAGFRWCPKKVAWTWHDSYTIYRSSKGRMDKEDIEEKYGKQSLKTA